MLSKHLSSILRDLHLLREYLNDRMIDISQIAVQIQCVDRELEDRRLRIAEL
jgi:hypothetical protein